MPALASCSPKHAPTPAAPIQVHLQANALINNVEDKDLTIKYQACYARIADSKRRFLDAAMKYYDLSQASAASYVL